MVLFADLRLRPGLPNPLDTSFHISGDGGVPGRVASDLPVAADASSSITIRRQRMDAQRTEDCDHYNVDLGSGTGFEKYRATNCARVKSIRELGASAGEQRLASL
jgi:hypothetical protein